MMIEMMMVAIIIMMIEYNFQPVMLNPEINPIHLWTAVQHTFVRPPVFGSFKWLQDVNPAVSWHKHGGTLLV